MHHEKDILEKHILEKNDVFADICRLVVPGMELEPKNLKAKRRTIFL